VPFFIVNGVYVKFSVLEDDSPRSDINQNEYLVWNVRNVALKALDFRTERAFSFQIGVVYMSLPNLMVFVKRSSLTFRVRKRTWMC
jgi:hypothetical protein